MKDDDIVWVWDLDEKQFVPLINIEDCIEPPPMIYFRFINLQEKKENQTHQDLLDELKKLFGEK